MHTLTTGLAIGESPRWHDGRLWLSDMGAGEVVAVDAAGRREVVGAVPAMPMGTGWLPDGRMLIVSARDARLLRREPDGSLVTHADLTGLATHPWSDMVVDGRGFAYVGNIGFAFPGGAFAPGTVALVRDGVARQVADGLAFPNGLAVTPDGATLIVAESYAHRLTAFDIAADGGLANRRIWADLGESAAPDGICVDAENAVWYADVPNRRCVRVREGGAVVQTVELDRGCFACALGGPDRRTLFLAVAEWPAAMSGGARTGEVRTVRVDVPGAGWP
jgi:sugar lactone lactonase YvrE